MTYEMLNGTLNLAADWVQLLLPNHNISSLNWYRNSGVICL